MRSASGETAEVNPPSKPAADGQPELFATAGAEDAQPQAEGLQSEAAVALEARELSEAVSLRTRSLIAPAPILELEADKSKRGLDLSQHDLRMLCLVVLDTVIDRMGFGSGATRRDVQIALAPILRGAEPGLTDEREQLILEVVLEALLNEKGRRQRFVARYAAIEGSAVRWMEFEYSLLEERQLEGGEGRVFRASKEAINLYTSMLGLDLEDAAIADAAVLRYQADRGRLDDAIQTAHQAQIRAKHYAEHIRARLEVAQRDVEQAAWVGQVLPVIDEALTLIADRIERERELRRGLELRQDQAAGEDLAKLTRLLNEIEKSERTNLDLHRLLLTANERFRDEHARQRLRRPSAALLPNLETDVFLPWLDSWGVVAQGLFAGVLNETGVHVPLVADLDALWSRLLAPPVVAEPVAAETVPPATAEVAESPPPFSREDFESSARFLRNSLNGPRRLSELLEDAKKQPLSAPACRLFVLLSMQQFGAAAERHQFRVEPVGETFAINGFAGDDLILSPIMSNLATTAHDAGKLVGFALRPRQTPWTSTEYAGLLERYESDSQFRAIVDGLTEGLGMRIVDVSTQGLFLSAAEGSPFRLAAEDYRQGMSAQDRVLHGVIQVAIAAFTFPKADVLDQDDTVAPAHITPTKLAEYIRNFAEAHAAKSPQEDQEEESVHRRTWREALARAVTMETSGGKESSRSLTGMCRYALNFLESQGLMRVVDAENSVYQGTTAYRVRLKYRAAHELLTLMRTTPPPKPAN